MNDASKFPTAGAIDAQAPSLDADLDSALAPRALFRRRPRRGLGDRAADRHHARLLGRQLGAFRLAGGQPGDAGLWAGERGDDRRQGLVRPPLARRRDGRARPVRAARGRRQSLCAASRLQRDLPRLRPGAEVEAVADFPGGADAVPGRRVFPRLRLPQEQPHVRARLFRRSRRGGPLRPGLPPGDVCVHASQSDRRAVGAVVRGLPRLGVRPWRARALSFRFWSPASWRSPAISSCRRRLA